VQGLTTSQFSLYLSFSLFEPGQAYVLASCKIVRDIAIFTRDRSPLKASQEGLTTHMKFSLSNLCHDVCPNVELLKSRNQWPNWDMLKKMICKLHLG
jgi:hypothetical protein